MSLGFQLLILTIERDLPVLRAGLPYLRRFLVPDEIILVASGACLLKARDMGLLADGVKGIDEDRMVEGLTLESVRLAIAARGGGGDRAGWYFKQLLILCYATRKDAGRYYLAWDADTIPVRPIVFFDEEGRALVTGKDEYHQPYFDTMHRLLGLGREAERSFIAEHLLFESEIAIDLIQKATGKETIDCAVFAERVLASVATEHLSGSGFSEYETYGTFASHYYPGRIVTRALPSLRRGTELFGRSPGRAQLYSISQRYFWASFESWGPGQAPTWKRRALRLKGLVVTFFALVCNPRGFSAFGRTRAEPEAVSTHGA